MTMIDIGITGAKRQSVRRANPRDVLRQIIEEGRSEQEAFKLFRERVSEHEDSEELNAVIMEYWFANNYRSLVQPLQLERTRAERQAMTDRIVENVKAHIEEKVSVILGDMVMPNGKSLRECTGKDCREMGPRIGEWLARVGRKVKAGQLVGDALSENDLQSLYLKA